MQIRMKLDVLLSKVKPDVNCLAETWFDSNVKDCEIFLSSNYYLQKRSDRQIGTHGGVMIAHKSNHLLGEVKTSDTT